MTAPAGGVLLVAHSFESTKPKLVGCWPGCANQPDWPESGGAQLVGARLAQALPRTRSTRVRHERTNPVHKWRTSRT
jgi:hypothetical protein